MNAKSRRKNFAQSIEHLQQKLPLSYPTETFYALGCLALSKQALDRLSECKQRDTSQKPYPTIIGSPDLLGLLVSEVTKEAQIFIDHFWPGPLTLILPAHKDLDPRLLGQGNGVAVRWSSHLTASRLSAELKQPLVSTSANIPGQASPQTAFEVEKYFPHTDVGILDEGKTYGGMPSTIISLLGSTPQILREGAISTEKLQRFI